MMTKLTLSVDHSVIVRAKTYAKRHGFSISEVVEAYLDTISKPRETAGMPPILQALQGTLRKGNPGDYRTHLRQKFG